MPAFTLEQDPGESVVITLEDTTLFLDGGEVQWIPRKGPVLTGFWW